MGVHFDPMLLGPTFPLWWELCRGRFVATPHAASAAVVLGGILPQCQALRHRSAEVLFILHDSSDKSDETAARGSMNR
ncbi:unnamed protein product [Heligmosomoides polygyrus]|uniref:Uncharacterized protein n=1 Tax=Heligmosomoides polygyrus TaxID=6339 RepID=A0A183GET5_HELPZ|nr:unnamed protein product [Heligmosomoides polygyrus]